MTQDVLGLYIIHEGAAAHPQLARIREQLQAADALLTTEREADEPPAVAACRREAEVRLEQGLYEDAEEAILETLDVGLEHDWFPWQAALNLVNCQRLLARPDDAAATAGQLLAMYDDQPSHPIRYLLATQLGALAADRYAATGDPAAAAEALARAREAYAWQQTHRAGADALRAYNLVVALLRCGHDAEARTLYADHLADEAFLTWCRQGDQARLIAERLG